MLQTKTGESGGSTFKSIAMPELMERDSEVRERRYDDKSTICGILDDFCNHDGSNSLQKSDL